MQRRSKRADLYNLLCYDLSGACTQAPPPLPADRTPGPEFKPKDKKTRDVEQMMRKMREENPNMPGMSMYSKVQLHMLDFTFTFSTDSDTYVYSYWSNYFLCLAGRSNEQ